MRRIRPIRCPTTASPPRREREQRQVRGGLLRLARRLREADPGTQAPTLWEPHKVATILLREAQHRHLPRPPLWKARDQWVRASADLAMPR
ncbi:MAG: hypothetical protein AAB289_01430 [Chloroflexota bacterium]